VAFVASPVEEDTQSLEKIAKKLRKEEIAVDIILIGQREQSQVEKLAKFIETINKNNNSSFFEVPPSLDGSLLASLSTTGLFSEFG
jgi:26S proteasome regulatory subunit N10